MSEDNHEIEKRLAKLSPLAQDALAAKILDSWATVKHDHRSAALPVSPPRFRLKTLSPGSALLGAIIGAAATFLAMITLMPPKVEVREVVREQPARPATEIPASPASNVAVEQVAPDPGTANVPIERARPRKNFEDQLAFADPSIRDIDALIAQREGLVRRMAVYESDDVSTDSYPVHPRMSPEAYREYIRDLGLKP